MVARVAVYETLTNKRSHVVAEAMRKGIARCGDVVSNRNPLGYVGVEADIAVFYGFDERLRRIFADYRHAGRHVVLIDLGYWERKELGGYYKVAVNDRHPTAYFQRSRHDTSRIKRFGIELKEWRQGAAIIVAGMSAKAAGAAGLQPQQWERATIEQIRSVSSRPIIYRPKPSWKEATAIPGALFSPHPCDFSDLLVDVHAVVSHHSNAAIDALIGGVPSFCWDGVAKPLSLQNLRLVERPARPDGREQWLADIAWCQWNVEEMTAGLPWRHLKQEGLLA